MDKKTRKKFIKFVLEAERKAGQRQRSVVYRGRGRRGGWGRASNSYPMHSRAAPKPFHYQMMESSPSPDSVQDDDQHSIKNENISQSDTTSYPTQQINTPQTTTTQYPPQQVNTPQTSTTQSPPQQVNTPQTSTTPYPSQQQNTLQTGTTSHVFQAQSMAAPQMGYNHHPQMMASPYAYLGQYSSARPINQGNTSQSNAAPYPPHVRQMQSIAPPPMVYHSHSMYSYRPPSYP